MSYNNTNNNLSYLLMNGIGLPRNHAYHMDLHPSKVMAYTNGFVTDLGFNYNSFESERLKWLKVNKCSGTSSKEEYYPYEFSPLPRWMNQRDLPDFTINANSQSLMDERSALEDAMFLARLALYRKSLPGVARDLIQSSWKLSPEELLWNQIIESEMLKDAFCYGKQAKQKASYQSLDHFQNFVGDYLEGFGEKKTCSNDPDRVDQSKDDQTRKRRMCRHFLKGHCNRGKACDFLHDPSIFCPNSQKVFLGGLPAHITEATLRQKLAQMGYKVINKPKVLRGFTPQVCLESIEKAKKLIEKRNIIIDGSIVDVRAYESFAKGVLDETRPDEIKRSVFLGGLAKGTTGQMIKDDLKKVDVKVINQPLVKTGFTPKVTFGTIKETNMLIKLKKVRINDTLVDVRPYVNIKSLFSSTEKQTKAQVPKKESTST